MNTRQTASPQALILREIVFEVLDAALFHFDAEKVSQEVDRFGIGTRGHSIMQSFERPNFGKTSIFGYTVVIDDPTYPLVVYMILGSDTVGYGMLNRAERALVELTSLEILDWYMPTKGKSNDALIDIHTQLIDAIEALTLDEEDASN